MPVGGRARAAASRRRSGGGGGSGVNRLPFNSSSPFKQSFAARFGSNAAVPIHPDNDLLIEAIKRSTSFPGPGVVGTLQSTRHFRWTTDSSQFTPAIYIVKPTTPLATVHWSGRKGESDTSTGLTTATSGGGGGDLSIPVDPTWRVPSGDDGQITVWDRDNVLNHAAGPQWWDCYACIPDTGLGNEGLWVQTGGKYQCSNIGHGVAELAGSGQFDGTVTGYVSRGAGQPYMQGHIFAWELEAAAAVEGTLSHAIVASCSSPYHQWVLPASKSDGSGMSPAEAGAGNPYWPPEGVYLKLRDDFDISSIPSAKGRVIARTLRDYGLELGDNSGRPKLYVDSNLAANDTAGWTGGNDTNSIELIPPEMFYVVDWEGGTSGRTQATGGWGTGVKEFSAGIAGGIAGVPAVLGTVSGSTAAGGATIASTTSQTPLVDELLLMLGVIGSTEDNFLTDTQGNGMTFGWAANQWRPYSRNAITFTGNRNLAVDTHVARAPASPSAGALQSMSSVGSTATTAPGNTNSKGIIGLRLTALSKIVRVAWANCRDVRSTVPTVTLKNASATSRLIGIVAAYRGNVNDNASGWTSLAMNVGPGGANTPRISVFHMAGAGADATLAPTIASSSEWVAGILEVT